MAQNSRSKSPILPDSSFWVSLGRGLMLGLANFWRNKFLSFATVVVMAVILFIFNVILGVHFIGNQALQALNDRVDIVVYLRDDISFDEAKTLMTALEALSGVKKVTYTSKDDALEIVAKTHPKTAEFLKKFQLTNPLPPSLSIITQQSDDYATVQAFLEQGEYKNLLKNYVTGGSTNDSTVFSTVAENLSSMSGFVRQIIFWLVLVFVLGGALVIVNALQLTLYTRRHEVTIMRLVGATPGFIAVPFVFEGVLYGFFAVLLSFLFLFFLGKTIHVDYAEFWNYYSSFPLQRIFFFELFMTLALSVLSSYSAVEQYMKGRLLHNS